MISKSIRGTRMALVVIDPQRKFTLDDADWKEGMRKGVEGINSFTRLFREFGIPVIFVHTDGKSHCPYNGEDGDEWLQGIETDPTDIIIHKRSMSCFKESSELEDILRGQGADCALYTGMLTEFCVVSTYFSSSERDIVPYLGKDATIP